MSTQNAIVTAIVFGAIFAAIWLDTLWIKVPVTVTFIIAAFFTMKGVDDGNN